MVNRDPLGAEQGNSVLLTTFEQVREHSMFRPDGSVLLSVHQDKLLRLNGIGTMAWEILAKSSQGLTAEQLAREMKLVFDEINREGTYCFEVPFEHLHADMTGFLEQTAARGLVRVEGISDTERHDVGLPDVERRFMVADGVHQNVSGASASVSEENAGLESSSLSTSLSSPSAGEVLSAIVALAASDAYLKLAGFAKTFKRLKERAVESGRPAGARATRRICEAVNRAQIFYPKKAMCLQRSIAATLLLRRRGIAAEMVVAAKDFPLAAHAWVEVDGRVVNDDQNVKTLYSAMTRL